MDHKQQQLKNSRLIGDVHVAFGFCPLTDTIATGLLTLLLHVV